MRPRRPPPALILAPLIALLIGSGGCSLSLDARTLGVPATLSSGAGQPVTGRRFEVTSRAVYFAWGIFSLRRPSLQRTLAGQLAGADAVSDVRIRVRSRWSDLLITGLTLGLIVPRAVTFEGVISGPGVPPAPQAPAAPETPAQTP